MSAVACATKQHESTPVSSTCGPGTFSSTLPFRALCRSTRHQTRKRATTITSSSSSTTTTITTTPTTRPQLTHLWGGALPAHLDARKHIASNAVSIDCPARAATQKNTPLGVVGNLCTPEALRLHRLQSALAQNRAVQVHLRLQGDGNCARSPCFDEPRRVPRPPQAHRSSCTR